MQGIIDTHAHLEEIEGLEQVLKTARLSNLIAIIAVGSDAGSNQRVLDIARHYPGFVFPALGLHPFNLNNANIQNDLDFIEDHADEAVGIGEIGLDYHKSVLASASKDIQKRVFLDLLRLAARHNKVALIHSRYAWRDCLNLYEESKLERAVFHWYTGPSSVLRDILAHGLYISATPAVEYHQEHRRAVREAPLDHLLLETDSPVVYARGREGEYKASPVDVRRSLEGTAQLKGVPASEIAEATNQNAMRLFGFSL